MSEFKAFLSGYKGVGHKFIPFLPDDNSSLDFDSTKVLISNVEGIKALLKGNFLLFIWYGLCFLVLLMIYRLLFLLLIVNLISELTSNQSWHRFVESYHLCRKKSGGEFIQDLWELDKLVGCVIDTHTIWSAPQYHSFSTITGVFHISAPGDLC